MKTQTNLTMADIMNFNQEVVNYINDNLSFIKDEADTDNPSDLAKAALNYYNRETEAFNEEDEYLSDEQKELFLTTAKRLFDQGFVEHAGGLHG